MKDIHEQIQTEIKNFTDNPIEIVPGYQFNQYQTIKRNHLYYNSQFEDQSLYNNREKIFDNIVSFRCEIASTLLDFDTKDSRLIGLNPKSEAAEFFLNKELELYMKNKHLDNLYNDIAQDLPVYGSVVIKKTKDVPVLVDLRRLFLDPVVDRIWESRFITIKHYLTASQLRAMKGTWDDEVIDKMLKDSSYLTDDQESYEDTEVESDITMSPYYIIYERYGEVPETWLREGKEDNYLKSVFIVSDPEAGENVTLFKSEWKKEWPFLDAHYKKTKGRWLGVGAIEECWPDQERKNELANQKRVAMEISTMLLFQTSDSTTLRNVLRDKVSGDIIKKNVGGEGLQPVDNRMKDLVEFQAEEQKWDAHADRMSFANDILRGTGVAASTPATNAVIQNTNSTSVFTKKRQRVADMLRRMFNEWVLPDLKKSISKEHILKFTGSLDDIKTFDKKILSVMEKKAATNELFNGKIANQDQIVNSIQSQLEERGLTRFINMEEGYYDDLEFEYDVIVDGQQKNLQTALQNVFQVMSVIAANPQALDDPRIKTLFYEYMKIAGVSPLKIEKADMERSKQVQGLQQLQQLLPQQSNQPNQVNIQPA